MALPKLGIPYYTMRSLSGRELKYRPFLVKEEKALLMAAESKDSKLIINTIKNTIESCISKETPVDVSNLPLFELEWLLLNIRMKSVGESSKFRMKCSKCEDSVSCNLDLNEVEVENKENGAEKKFKLTNTVGVTVQQPPYKILDNVDITKLNEVDEKKLFMETILDCIVNIFDENQVYTRKDFTREDLTNFVDDMTQEQITMISDYLQKSPRLSYQVAVNCKKCGNEEKRRIEGLNDFF